VARSEDELRRALAGVFRPELVGRIGRVIEFLPLGPRELALILGKTLRAVIRRADSQGISVTIEADAEAVLLARVGAAELGARVVEQVVDEAVTRPLAAGIVEGRFARSARVHAVAIDGQVGLVAR
jgi:ATP-dependent Clp protease ATP-binding subunit ClpA